MKILHVVQSLKGGPASYFDETVPDQVTRYGADNVALVVPTDDLQYLSGVTKSAKFYTFASRKRSARSLVQFHAAFRRALQEFQPDIIHLHSTFAGAICRASLMFSKSRAGVIYCSHGWAFDMGGAEKPSLKKRLIVQVEKMLAWRTHLVINISEADQTSALRHGIGRGKSVVVYNGVSDHAPLEETRHAAQERLGMDTAKVNVLFVGRFDRQKGFDTAVEAFHKLDPARFHLYAIGDFVVSNARRESDRLALSADNISLLGWKHRSELPPYFAAADVVVMPSRWEGFGLVAVEAMRMNTPVLAASVGALPELVIDRVCGRLVESGDADGLAKVLEEESKTSWHDYGRQARSQFLDKFTSGRLNATLANLYSKLIQGEQKWT